MEQARKELGMELNRDNKPPLGALVQVMLGMELFSAYRKVHSNGKFYYDVSLPHGLMSPVDDEDIYGWRYHKN